MTANSVGPPFLPWKSHNGTFLHFFVCKIYTYKVEEMTSQTQGIVHHWQVYPHNSFLWPQTPSPTTVVLHSTQFPPVWILEPLTPTSCTHLSAASCVRRWATGSSASFSPSKNNLLVWRDKRRKKRELASTSKDREEGKNRARCKLVVSPHWLALNEMACKGNGTLMNMHV